MNDIRLIIGKSGDSVKYKLSQFGADLTNDELRDLYIDGGLRVILPRKTTKYFHLLSQEFVVNLLMKKMFKHDIKPLKRKIVLVGLC